MLYPPHRIDCCRLPFFIQYACQANKNNMLQISEGRAVKNCLLPGIGGNWGCLFVTFCFYCIFLDSALVRRQVRARSGGGDGRKVLLVEAGFCDAYLPVRYEKSPVRAGTGLFSDYGWTSFISARRAGQTWGRDYRRRYRRADRCVRSVPCRSRPGQILSGGGPRRPRGDAAGN